MQVFPTERRVKFVTVTPCTGTEAAARGIEARTGGAVENMEGAAVAHVAHLHGVPVGEVRGISNIVTDRDPLAWRLKDAAVAAQEALLAWIAQPVNFAFSSCPNDTFAFHALVHGLVPAASRVTPHIDDIEALNMRAARRRRRSDQGVDRRVWPRAARSLCAAAGRRRGRVRRRSDRGGAIDARRSAAASPFPASAPPRISCCGSLADSRRW